MALLPGTVIAGDADEGIKIVEAAGRITRSGVAHVAVRLLPHMKQAVHHIARKAVIREGGGAGDREEPVGKVGKVRGPACRSRTSEARKLRCAEDRDLRAQTMARWSAARNPARRDVENGA